MTAAIVLASSVLAVLLVVALSREIRRRRATQILASRILEHWRSPHGEDLVVPRPVGSPDQSADRLRRD